MLQRGYEAEWLDKTFSKAIFLGNGLVSIVSGLLANYLVTDLRCVFEISAPNPLKIIYRQLDVWD